MDDDKSAVEEFLGGLNQPKDDPFKSDDPFAPKAKEEVESVEEEEKEEKPVPFHKDPKVTRFIEKEVAKRLADFKPATPEAPSKETEDEMTDVLVRIIGNDTPEKQAAVKDFRRVLGSLEEKGAQRALAQLEAQAEESAEADRQAMDELDSSFEEIEDTYGVDISSNTPQARKTRVEFVDFVRKIAPKDENGEVASFPDMLSAFETFQESKQRPASNRAKDLASRGLSRSKDVSTTPQTTDKSWNAVDKLFSKLTK